MLKLHCLTHGPLELCASATQLIYIIIRLFAHLLVHLVMVVTGCDNSRHIPLPCMRAGSNSIKITNKPWKFLWVSASKIIQYRS